MVIEPKIIDELLKDYETPEDLIGKKGILKQLTKSLLERALEAELTIILATKNIPPMAIAPAIHATGTAKRKS